MMDKYKQVKERLDEIKQWINEGVKKEEIAKRLGVSQSTLHHLIHIKEDVRETFGTRDKNPKMPDELDSYLALCGAVIKNAMKTYQLTYYHKLRGDKKFWHPILSRHYSVEEEYKRLEDFFNGEGFEFWSQGMVDAGYIKEYAIKKAKDTYKMETKIKSMTTEEIETFIELCKKELKKRKDTK